MGAKHKQREAVRAYLLGKLPNDEAVALEMRYLADRAFFLRIREIESGLIRDYLAGRCAPAEVALFEERYLRVADLRARLEEIRAEREGIYPKRAFPWPYALVTSVGLIAVSAIGMAVYVQRSSRDLPRSEVVSEFDAAPLKVALRAGVAQSSGASMEVLRLPTKAVPVDFVLELPIRTNEPCRAVLSEIDANAGIQVVLSSTAELIPARVGEYDQITFRVGSAQLHRGDYIISVRKRAGSVIASFLFRAL